MGYGVGGFVVAPKCPTAAGGFHQQRGNGLMAAWGDWMFFCEAYRMAASSDPSVEPVPTDARCGICGSTRGRGSTGETLGWTDHIRPGRLWRVWLQGRIALTFYTRGNDLNLWHVSLQ